MRKQILAGAVMIALASFMTTGAAASDRNGGHHAKSYRAGGLHHAGTRHASRYAAGNRQARRNGNSSDGSPYAEGGFIDLGPLGITSACGARNYQRGTCGSGYSVSGWSY